MSKKKHPEHVNHERWLVSYADFITLLFAFFVVLFASGQTDKRKQVKLAAAMQTAFQHNGIFEPHAPTPPISDEAENAHTGDPTPLALPIPAIPSLAAQAASLETQAQVETHLRQAISKAVKDQVADHTLAADAITIHTTQEGLVISLHEAGFFPSGSADIRPATLATLRAVTAALPRGPVRIEGHTDNLPIHTAQFATNWELSTARAAAITRLLLAEGTADPTQITAAGLAEFHPTATNATEQGRAQNRRVDIVLLAAVSKPRPTFD